MTSMARMLEFLEIPERSQKPRRRGLTIARDDGIGFNYARDLLETIGSFLDYVKIRHLFVLQALADGADCTLKKVALYREHDIHVFPGGIVFEIAYLQGRSGDYFERIAAHGFDAVECSENIVALPDNEARREVIGAARRSGLKVLYEVGEKYPENPRPVSEMIADIDAVLSAGAEVVIIERSYTDQLLGPHADQPGQTYIDELIQAVGLERLTFELESPLHQKWFLDRFGPDVNIGPNLPLEMVMKLEPTRLTLSREGGYTWLQAEASRVGMAVAPQLGVQP